MLPDLGKYAVPVLAAYASMIVLLGGLILISLRNAKKSKETLARLEANRKPK
ncbi:MAG TPA: heme exporter protein CcmD [Rhodobacteraceae bacterium]|nr:heme exporter protein CcmD [Paracoccaceae bacterium]